MSSALPNRPPLPPFTEETAAQKVRMAEDAGNMRDPEGVSLAYTTDSIWRNRSQFLTGREAIVQFLTQKWNKELDYRLIKELWAYQDSVRGLGGCGNCRRGNDWADLLRGRGMGERNNIFLVALLFILSMCVVDLCIADPPSAQIAYTITGAADYPMFESMLSGMKWMFGLMFGAIVALVGAMWRDIKHRIGTQRLDDVRKCSQCSRKHSEEHGWIWNALDDCCPREVISNHRPK